MCELIRRAPAGGDDRRRRPHRQSCPTSASGSTPTTSSAARASRGSARSWARTPSARSGTRRSCPASARGRWACPFGRGDGETAATLIPSVGCPMGCNFCSTSAMFGGKGKFVNFYETGDELFEVMCGLEQALEGASFFVMDENFLLHRKRALRLLELMQRARQGLGALRLQLGQRPAAVHDRAAGRPGRLLGLDGPGGRGQPVREAQGHRHARAGATTCRRTASACSARRSSAWKSTRREHRRAIDYAVAHDTEFHQFMLYTPVPGTPLHAEHRRDGTLLAADGVPRRRHPRAVPLQLPPPAHPERGGDASTCCAPSGATSRSTGRASSASRARCCGGWLALKDHPDPRVRDRVAFETKDLATQYAGALWASERWFDRRNADARGPLAPHPPRHRAGVRVEGASRGPGGRPRRSRDALARGTPAAPRSDLRAADLLRVEPGRGGAVGPGGTRGCALPLGRGDGRTGPGEGSGRLTGAATRAGPASGRAGRSASGTPPPREPRGRARSPRADGRPRPRATP